MELVRTESPLSAAWDEGCVVGRFLPGTDYCTAGSHFSPRPAPLGWPAAVAVNKADPLTEPRWTLSLRQLTHSQTAGETTEVVNHKNNTNDRDGP